MVPARNARLLLLSSQASPPGSQQSFHKEMANLTDSMVSLLFSATVLPSASTSLPPQDHRKGYQKTTGSPKVWPSDWPKGRPLALNFLPASRSASQVCGKLSPARPISSNHEVRLVNSPPPMLHGTAIHFLPSLATIFEIS